MSHGLSEIILICCFAAQETFNFNVQNRSVQFLITRLGVVHDKTHICCIPFMLISWINALILSNCPSLVLISPSAELFSGRKGVQAAESSLPSESYICMLQF